MENRRRPETREEKIAFLKQLARGQVKATDIVSTIKLCLFEIEPGEYEGIVNEGATGFQLIDRFSDR